MGETITTNFVPYWIGVGDVVRVTGRMLHVWRIDGRTLSVRREPVNRWGNKMARWRERRAA